MFPRFLLTIILLKMGYAQLDGEFRWLKDEFTKFVRTKAPTPIYEDLSETDTDESSKVIFKDDNYLEDISDTASNTNSINRKEEKTSKEQSRQDIRPSKEDVFNASKKWQHSAEAQTPVPSDKFMIKFLKNDNAFKKKTLTTKALPVPVTKSNHVNVSHNNSVFYDDKITLPSDDDDSSSENNCTYMKKNGCHRKNGEINIDVKDEKKYTTNENLICCILPLNTKDENVPSKISSSINTRRPIRSKKQQAPRNILLSHNYAKHNRKTKPTLHYDETDYYDPYLNIKNHKETQNPKRHSNVKDNYNHNDYQEDYYVEIPAPGLSGPYSNIDYDEQLTYDDEDNTDFGYTTTIDPRRSSNKNKNSKPRRKLSKVKPVPEEAYNGLDSEIISYQADPNFNALQDFKLPNLTRKKALKKTRSTTTESFHINDYKTRSTTTERFYVNDYKNDIKEETTYGPIHEEVDRNSALRQVYEDCGATAKPLITSDKEMGFTAKGSHPWLALLVPTHKQNKLLCYASLIHTRAAISAGDCVHSTAPGEVTLIAGLWILTERPGLRKRVIHPLLHPKYKSGFMDNNLAMLHWKQPLKLGLNVQPICLGKPSPDLECVFVGWGGFDQAIRTKSRWQRATIQNCQAHTSLIGIDIPKEAFCATVASRSTVTGIGGSLICITGNHLSAVGVAVSRDSTLILLPTYEWITSPSIESFIGVPEE